MDQRRPQEGSPARAALTCARGRSAGRLVLLALAVSACASVAGCSSSADELDDAATVVPQRTYRVMLQGPVPMGREPLGEVVITPENAPPRDAPIIGGPADPGVGTPAAPAAPAPVAPGAPVPLPPGAPPPAPGPGPGTGPGAGTRPEEAPPPRELPASPPPRGPKTTRNPFAPPGTPGALRKARPVVVAAGTPLAGPVPSGRAPLRQVPGRAVRVGPVPVVPGSTRGLPVGPPTRPATPAPALVVLGPGSAGEGVREVQQRLAADGWRGRVDGVFGPRTRLEVQSFQRRRGLVADGIVGRETWAALRSREAQP